MLRFVDQEGPLGKEKPPAPSFGAETLDMSTPEMAPGPYFPGQDLMRDKYIRQNPGSGITRLPAGEQGPAQGPYTPVKQYPEGYMPEGGEPAPAFAAPIRRAKSSSPRPDLT